MHTSAASLSFEQLISGPHIHGRLYRDPDVFDRELEAIWYKVWVYVGHGSEVPLPGDLVRRQIGLQPVIMIRGDDGQIRVFFNRCRHRGNLLTMVGRTRARADSWNPLSRKVTIPICAGKISLSRRYHGSTLIGVSSLPV
jgi:Rieske [2Fe-2S] domain